MRRVLRSRHEALSSESEVPSNGHQAVQPHAPALRGERSALRDGKRASGAAIRRQCSAPLRAVLLVGKCGASVDSKERAKERQFPCVAREPPRDFESWPRFARSAKQISANTRPPKASRTCDDWR